MPAGAAGDVLLESRGTGLPQVYRPRTAHQRQRPSPGLAQGHQLGLYQLVRLEFGGPLRLR